MDLADNLESACAYVDISRLPLVVQKAKNIRPTLIQTQDHLDLIEKILAHTTEKLYVISDMRAMKWANMRSVIHLGKGMYRLDKQNRGRIQLHVFISSEFILRTLIPLFNVFARLEGNQICTKTMEEAVDWISLQSGKPFF